MYIPSETFKDMQGESQKICLTASNKMLNFYVNGLSVAAQAPIADVSLAAGGKIQIGNDPGEFSSKSLTLSILHQIHSVSYIDVFQLCFKIHFKAVE